MNNTKQDPMRLQTVALFYRKAASCYERVFDVNKSVDCLSQAIAMFKEEGNLKETASCYSQIASLYQNYGDVDKAIANFESAADCYQLESSSLSHEANCLKKVAEFCAITGNFSKAIDKYERVVFLLSSNGNLAKAVLHKYYFFCGICHIANVCFFF
eukprot:TRINITY_DN3595_c0_g2_i1.p1 TRINITY_DN3595_c0_g2~~TRINITY_DN3595_c0_g2_i1.p1  ORF type:complete len:157 (-),score=32.37 TRINITY_DN3595_c0_g2_i1:157-627(-)